MFPNILSWAMTNFLKLKSLSSALSELRMKEFIFASVQCFLNTQPHVRPVEIAMVKWSMDKGIIDQFSELVHPGNVFLDKVVSHNFYCR